MKCKIEKVWTLINPDGIAYRRFRTRFAKKIFFINEIDFLNHTELIMILDAQIILKEPVNQNFNLDKIQVDEKTLVIIKPKKEGLSTFRDIDPAKINVLKGTLPPITGFEESLKSMMKEEGFTSELKEENNAKETATDADGFIDITEPDFDELDYEEPDPDEPDFDELDYEEPDFPDVDIDELRARAVGSGQGMDLDAFLKRKAVANQQTESKEEPSVPASDFLEKSGEKEITRGTPVNINKFKEALKNSKRNISELTEEDVAKKSSNEVAKPKPNLNDFLKANIESKAAQKTNDPNITFFKEMILLATNEKVDSSSKNRLFKLIGSELQKTKSVEITILEKIQSDLTNLIKGKKPPEPPTVKPKPSHAPRATFNFLMGFRYPAESPFKFLTHSQANETDELGNIIPLDPAALTTNLNQAKNHPALIKDFLGKEAQNFEPIHNDIREKAKELIKLYEKVLNNHQLSAAHPYEVSADYKGLCEDFKRNFRIGNSVRETNLRKLIQFASQTQIHRFKPEIIFYNGETAFDRLAVFFSWMPALRNTFQYIFSEIESNSNINGSMEFDDEKKITIKLQDDPQQDDPQQDDMILDIIDHQSKCPDSPTLMLKKLRDSKPTQLNNLWGLCNWTIYADFPDGPFKVHIISDNHNEYEAAPVVKLENSVGAFMHRITFYKP